jgi:hypothetical protein
VPHKSCCRGNIDLDPARFANDAPEEFVDGAIVKRTGVEVLQSRENVLLAIGVAKRQVGGFFERADLERESRSDVQKTQQFGINFIDFFTPMLYIHRTCSVLGNKKPAATFSGSRLARLKVLCLLFMFSAHLFRTSPARSPRKRRSGT